MNYIGIDPGLSGAVAIIYPEHQVKLYDTPVATTTKTKKDYLISMMADIIRNAVPYKEESAFVVIEAVHSMPKQGVASSFSFGRGLGLWEGIIVAYNLSYVKVSPQRWKAAMMADMAKEDKDASRIAATRLFPNAMDMLSRKKDHGRAEALLMAEYGRRLNKQ